MALIVQKFGGTSVGSIERIRNVAWRVAKWQAAGHRIVVVPSAMSGETNRLLTLAAGLQEHPDPRELDVVAATGEQVSVGLLAMALLALGVKARSYAGWQVKVLTDSAFTRARIISIDEVNLRQLQAALRDSTGLVSVPDVKIQPGKKAKTKSPQDSGLLIVGVDRLMTQLARCCKPVPPDPVRGFVTRGKGVTVHREDCASLKRLAERSPERLIDAQWGNRGGNAAGGAYPVDVLVTAADRQGLLRDIGEALARERINVTAVRTQSRDELAHMRFSFEVADVAHLRRAFAAVKQVAGVIRAGRG